MKSREKALGQGSNSQLRQQSTCDLEQPPREDSQVGGILNSIEVVKKTSSESRSHVQEVSGGVHELVDGTLKLGTREGFGEAVCQLVLSLDVFELDNPFLPLVLGVANDVQVVAEGRARRVGVAHGHRCLAVAEDLDLLCVVIEVQVAEDERQAWQIGRPC